MVRIRVLDDGSIRPELKLFEDNWWLELGCR